MNFYYYQTSFQKHYKYLLFYFLFLVTYYKQQYLFPNPRCELDYTRDYELLIATVLSAQSTDKRVNSVTKILFRQFDIFSLKDKAGT